MHVLLVAVYCTLKAGGLMVSVIDNSAVCIFLMWGALNSRRHTCQLFHKVLFIA